MVLTYTRIVDRYFVTLGDIVATNRGRGDTLNSKHNSQERGKVWEEHDTESSETYAMKFWIKR